MGDAAGTGANGANALVTNQYHPQLHRLRQATVPAMRPTNLPMAGWLATYS